MEISAQAPCRLSIAGGGTDLEPYASRFGGICINLAINLRQHFIFSDDGRENVYPVGANPHFYDEFFKEFDWHPKSVISTFDTNIESGLGASASAAVALVASCAKAKGLTLTRNEIAEKAWDIEVNKLGLYGGRQDQYASAFGGLNLLLFEDKVYRYRLNPRGLEILLPSFLLFYTGSNRQSSKIQEGFKKLTNEQIKALDGLKEIAYQAIDPIENGDVKKVGELLALTWELKKSSNKGVSNERIDIIYEKGRQLGAFGAKLLGAGGGGHMLFIAPPEKHNMITAELSSLGCTYIDFSPDFNGVEVRKA